MCKNLILFLVLFFSVSPLHAQDRLKWVIYDFDGLNLGQTDLPDGDFRGGDLSYQVAANPVGNSDMLGDRVLQLDLNWSGGTGNFGKTNGRFIEINPAQDHLNFFFYNPSSNNKTVTFKVLIGDDDNDNNSFSSAEDDQWQQMVTVTPTGTWNLISLPLNQFTDINAGGNGVFDLGYTGAGGMFVNVNFQFSKASDSPAHEQYFIDMISLSEGNLPHGNTIFDLPGKSPGDHCVLGAYTIESETHPEQVPNVFEGVFNDGQKITFVNWFMAFSENGSPSPNRLPGNEVSDLLNRGYRPIITWEALYNNWARLDPIQPRLNDLISGKFDSYYDAFGDKLKSYNDTVIVRFMHEFEGNWYPWSLTENAQDPALYIKVFRYVVDRVRARGASKVKWMWCLNAEPAPYRKYNWVMSAYPGDAYVDIVATDIYNHPNLGIPDWKSFRYTGIESYYYLTKYLPHKPLYVCEVASRERDASEPASSQTKAEWELQMNKEMQSFFSKARALIFFHAIKEHDWRVNSSTASLDVIRTNIWTGDYYRGRTVNTEYLKPQENYLAYPNPFQEQIHLKTLEGDPANTVQVFDVTGRLVYKRENDTSGIIDLKHLKAGIYLLRVKNSQSASSIKIIKGF